MVHPPAGERGDRQHRRVRQEPELVGHLAADLGPPLGVELIPLVEHEHDRGTGAVDPFGEPLILVGHAFRRVDRGTARRRPGRSPRARARGCSTRSARRSGSCAAARRCRRSAAGRLRSRPRCRSRRASCPGRSCTTERSSPTRRLKSVDLPTLGRPTIATEKMPSRSAVVVGGHLFGRRLRQRGDDRVEQLARQPTVDRRHRPRIAETEPQELVDVGLALLAVDLVDDDDHRNVAALQHLARRARPLR